VIHAQFPSLLQVAIANHPFLEDQSPMAWTKSQVLRQVYDFLGMDEILDEAAAPRPESRTLTSAEFLTTSGEGLESGHVSESFLLPRWTTVPHPADDLLLTSQARTRYETMLETEALSRAETLQWASGREFWLRRTIDLQIEKEELDGLIEVAKGRARTGPSPEVDDAASKQRLAARGEALQDNKFVWEGVGWTIMFRGESCRLPQSVGLDYISILLQHPGKELKALQLQALAAGTTVPMHILNDDVRTRKFYDPDLPSESPASHRDELVDEKTSRQLNERIQWLELEIAQRRGRGDLNTKDLEKELADIQAYLEASQNVRGRTRAFPDENEKARQSITHALVRAYKRIRRHAPLIANHFESHISRGSEFAYRDSNTRWHLRRTQPVRTSQ